MAIPTEHGWRDYAVYLKGPAGFDTYAFSIGSTSGDRDGVLFRDLIADFPEPADNATDEFGIQTGAEFEVEIVDESNDDDWPLLDGDGEILIAEDGASQLIQSY